MTGSIKLFQFIQKIHQIIGIYPLQPNQKNRFINSINIILLTCCVQFTVTTVAFLAIEAESMFDYGFGFFMLICTLNAIVIYLIFIWQSENTFKFIGNCDGFIAKRVHSTIAYKELMRKIELFNKFLCFSISCSLLLLFFTVLPYTLIRYYIFNLGVDSFYLFCPSWYPFDWKTPFGYFIAWLAQCALAPAAGSVYTQFSNFAFGSGWFFIFIAEDLAQDVVAFNSIVNTTSNENRAKLTKHFCDLVQIYSDAKQCLMEFNQINKYSLFAFFSWNMLAIFSMLVTLQFELWADDSNLFEIVSLSYVLFWMTIFIFLLCEPGARMTNQFGLFCDEIGRFDWYLLPIELQRIYMVFLSDTQNQMKMTSYANITCERDTCKKIINTAFSYFMTFRRFGS